MDIQYFQWKGITETDTYTTPFMLRWVIQSD